MIPTVIIGWKHGRFVRPALWWKTAQLSHGLLVLVCVLGDTLRLLRPLCGGLYLLVRLTDTRTSVFFAIKVIDKLNKMRGKMRTSHGQRPLL